MKDFKKKTKEERYKFLYDYREKLMKYPFGYAPNAATVETANKFNVTVITVYRAIKFIRSGGSK
jgi:DNA invertase Pin-like site-specific DNA recombinase